MSGLVASPASKQACAQAHAGPNVERESKVSTLRASLRFQTQTRLLLARKRRTSLAVIRQTHVISEHLERFSSVVPTAVVEIVQEEREVERLNNVIGDAGLTAIPDK